MSNHKKIVNAIGTLWDPSQFPLLDIFLDGSVEIFFSMLDLLQIYCGFVTKNLNFQAWPLIKKVGGIICYQMDSGSALTKRVPCLSYFLELNCVSNANTHFLVRCNWTIILSMFSIESWSQKIPSLIYHAIVRLQCKQVFVWIVCLYWAVRWPHGWPAPLYSDPRPLT